MILHFLRFGLHFIRAGIAQTVLNLVGVGRKEIGCVSLGSLYIRAYTCLLVNNRLYSTRLTVEDYILTDLNNFYVAIICYAVRLSPTL